MSTVPKITDEHWQAADKATGGYNYVEMCNKAIEIALAEQQETIYPKISKNVLDAAKEQLKYRESKYITAAQARELGAGNAEVYYLDKWIVCGVDCNYWHTCNGVQLKYRAIKQAQPEPVDEQLYCMVSKDGEPAIRMLRTDAQELQRKLGDTVDWFMPEPNKVGAGLKIAFTLQGTYTYRTKATIKLGGNMVTPEQAAAEWRAKKETHVLWFKFVNIDWTEVIRYPEDYVKYFADTANCEYQLRPKQPTWTGSREDVLALLKEMGVA